MSTEFVVVGVLGGLITGGLILYIIYDLFDIMALTEESAELFREELIAVLADEHARIDEYRAAVAEKEKNLE